MKGEIQFWGQTDTQTHRHTGTQTHRHVDTRTTDICTFKAASSQLRDLNDELGQTDKL